MVLTLLLSLFGLGQGLIDTSSAEIGILALASLVLSLVTNYLWSIQAAELSQTDINLVNFDIALEAKANAVPVFITAPSKKGQSKQPKKDIKELKAEAKKDTLYSGSTFDKAEKADKADKSEKAPKAPVVKQAVVNPDQMSIAEQEALLAQLTDREREVFSLAAEGMKNGQIAEALSSTESSIKVHRSRMVSKLAISNVEGLAKLKKNLGLGAALVAVEATGPELTLESTTTLSQGPSDSTLSYKTNPPEGT
jgi:DNA-binding CsgD family transcriptional regulator